MDFFLLVFFFTMKKWKSICLDLKLDPFVILYTITSFYRRLSGNDRFRWRLTTILTSVMWVLARYPSQELKDCRGLRKAGCLTISSLYLSGLSSIGRCGIHIIAEILPKMMINTDNPNLTKKHFNGRTENIIL
jgi:hypothetical protein